jgi:hypothetical protein
MIVGISVVKPAAWSSFWQIILSDIYIFLMILFSIILWVVSLYFGEYFERKSDKMGNREWNHVGNLLGRSYGRLSGLLERIYCRGIYAPLAFLCTLAITVLVQILARHVWKIPL